jgi:hypothetical protein
VEEKGMMLRYIGALMLSVSLLAPVTVYAQDRDHATHQWNDNENQYWHQYLKEHHKKDHDWAKAKKSEQSDYWKWRDAHPDKH